MHASGVNQIDGIIRAGVFPLIGQPPFILGWDVSGVVEEVVPGTSRFAPGDEVFGMPFFPRPANAYAEYIAAPSRQLARKPANIDHAQAAALPLAGLTAWQSLVDIADVQAGQRVLIHGGAGGVGHLAVQIAKARGAYVVATASAGKHDFVRDIGADEVIDYQAVDFATAVGDLDVVLEVIGGDYAERSRAGAASGRAARHAPSSGPTPSSRRRSRPPTGASRACRSSPTTSAWRRSPSSSSPAVCGRTCRPGCRCRTHPERTSCSTPISPERSS